ncbi:hypothetical protein Taro_018957 [Colocasia esculenta]|uniref:Uncharacterized protein n=1 Tax=Colocasia esculenta TaxID=4460 RepID=A0A843UXS2_COLES|nr:hypothetical protein [Colocasia esculenta]
MLLSDKIIHWLFPRLLCHRLLLDARHVSTAALVASRKRATAASAAAAAAEPHFLVGYLVESCGFSKSKAAEVSKPILGRIKSAENPAAVISFLRGQGFTKDRIRRFVSGEPSVLCSSVSEALEPKIRALKDAGFSGSDIPTLFSTKPQAFRVSDLGAKVRFWAALFNSKEKLLKALLKHPYILHSSLDEKMKPNVSLLSECVGSEHRVAKIISKRPQLLSAKTDSLREVVRRVERLGISRGSGLFDKALYLLYENSIEAFDAKFELLKSFGWSESEFLSAIQKNPNFLGSSKKKIQFIMEFLLKEAGCEPSYAATHPNILTFSLEGRMKPRHRFLTKLALDGLSGERDDIYNVTNMTEKCFLKRYVLRHGEKALELYRSFLAACTREKPS